MSFKLFNQGYTAQEIQERKKAGIVEAHAQEELVKWKESERVLSHIRSIKAFNEKLDEEILKRWQQFRKRK